MPANFVLQKKRVEMISKTNKNCSWGTRDTLKSDKSSNFASRVNGNEIVFEIWCLHDNPFHSPWSSCKCKLGFSPAFSNLTYGHKFTFKKETIFCDWKYEFAFITKIYFYIYFF
uniref:Uncharacterized protein n=1 Tax=Cacopsylla melanoneura TaxID=428564 RepID=A0A8D8PSP3_9HEMI